jgi:SAM-dependent methyltransferase
MIIRLTLLERLLHRLHLLPTPVMDAFAGVLFGRALAIAVRRGLFEALASGRAGAGELSAVTGMSREGVALIADACVVGGYLRRRGARYELASEGKKWLLGASPDSLVHLIRYFETLHHRWSELEGSLDRGEPARPYYASFTDEDWRIYVLAMRELARQIVPHVLKAIAVPAGPACVVDIGGSHGLYTLALCAKHPGLRAVIMDFPPAAALADGYIREAGLADRVTTLAGDFMELPIPQAADLILMFNVVHGLSREENAALVARALGALRPGGRLYVLDQWKTGRTGSGIGRFIPLMVGLNLLNEIGGTAYGVEDVRGWCAGEGRLKPRGWWLPGVKLLEIVKTPGGVRGLAEKGSGPAA